jgi:PTS system cellobiose-specific IIC component
MLNSERLDGGFASSYFGGEGLFAAMVLSILICESYRWLIQNKVGRIKLPDSVPDAISASFESLVPAIIILTVATIFGHILRSLGTSLPVLILSLFRPIIKSVDSVFGAAFVTLITQVFWWFGIHDSAVGAIIGPIRDANLAANAAAYASGTAIADLPYVFTSAFYWTFGTIGGSGATLALVLLMIRSKSTRLKTVGKIGLIPSLFNINEPILFGMPIVLNPIMLIPFLSAQTLNVIITYLCMAGGIVNKTMVDPSWNMFAPIGALIATLDIKAVVLLLLLIAMDALIYYPFFKIQEKKLLAEDTEGIA